MSPEFEAKVKEASLILDEMGVKYGTIESRHYQLLFVGKRGFAKERKAILEATRRNFLGFMRRMDLKIDTSHKKLLVILLDTQAQMQQFGRLASGVESNVAGWVAGYYDPKNNWAVFYNQRKGNDVEQIEANLNRLAHHLLSIQGGPDVIVRVSTPSGWVDKSKRQVATEMEAEWARIIRLLTEFNTTVTQHEGTHQIAHNVGVQDRDTRYPFWISEGLACVFEVPPSKKGRGSRGAGKVNKDRLAAFRKIQRKGKALGIRNMIQLEETGDSVAIGALYAESWAMFAYLFNRHATELSAYMRHLSQRKDNPDAPELDELQVFERYFRKSVPELQTQLDAYISRLKP